MVPPAVCGDQLGVFLADDVVSGGPSMSIQGNIYCAVAALAIVAGYLAGGALAVNCEQGCKSVEGLDVSR
jgi:hypothetical protein